MGNTGEGYQKRNRAVWNRLAESNSRFARAATDEECRQPLQTLDSRNWLPASVAGWNVLCLGSAGGWQSILYASAGASVTVVDISPSMLQLDVKESRRRGLQVRTVEGSMDDLSMLEPAQFDLIHQPVSTCYVPDLAKVYREIARVTKPGGIYISQHKQPASLQITHRNERNHFVIGIEYYHQGVLPLTEDTAYRESGADEYLHRWEVLVGELCRSGFMLEDLVEPYRADPTAPVTHFRYRGRFTPPYVRLKARRVEQQTPAAPPQAIWVP